MQPVKITVKDHVGRELNPHRKPKYIDQVPYIQSESNKLWIKFERSVIKHPCPELANTKPGETVMAELVWQMRANRDLVEAGIDKEIKWIDVNIDLIDGLRPEALRQIWRLIPKEEKQTIRNMKTGIELIAEERQEQIEKHGFNANRDSQYKSGELAAAARYLLTGMAQDYPRNWSIQYKHQFDIKPHIEQLIVAGALIAAEIDRLTALTPPTLK